MLRIAPLSPPLPTPAMLQAVLVTSANALAGLPPAFHAVPLLTVGGATAARARALGFCDVQSADADAPALAALTAACHDPAGRALLVAHGEGQAETLVGLLHAAGFTVQRAAVYAARPVAVLPADAESAWSAGTLSAALFYSADTARAFAGLIERARMTEGARAITAIAIAAATANALAPLPWRTVRVALRPDQDAMLALLP